jgi:AraC-like DNA-binding protein
MTYWIDEQRESVFCLIEAPEKEAVKEMHQKAHGLIPNKIIEVSSSVVQAFLGRIYDPEEAVDNQAGLKVFSEPGLRTLMVTKTIDPVLLQYKLGKEKANVLLEQYHKIIRKNIKEHNGNEVEHGGNDFIVSFISAANAFACALAIQTDIPDSLATSIDFKMSLKSGEPVEKSNKLFGDTVQLAQQICALPKPFKLALASEVKDMVAKENIQKNDETLLMLTPQDEALLESLFSKLEEQWQNPDFDLDEYCQSMAMSKSQLYRKTIALTGLSPNILLKEYRLERAKQLMKKQFYSISQITFDSGFTSPSYFTKCFKKKYGLLPMNYVELLQ